MRYAAFLRGINVGGHKSVSMADLKKALESLGFTNVKTLLASGNAVFDAPAGNAGTLAAKIEKKLAEALGHEICVIIRTAAQMQALVDSAPFSRIKVTPQTRLFVTLLKEKPRTRLKIPYLSPDKSYRILTLTTTEACSVLTLGPQWSKNLRQMDILEKELGKRITTRTWNTVVKVAKACSDASG